jgi:periplasmic copper chaperone A
VRKLTSFLGIASAIVVTVLSVTGCSSNGPIGAGNAYIPVPATPGTTVAYLEIRNNGAADELVSARTSIGGTVVLRGPVTRGTQVMSMRDVDDIPIPANSTVHLDPDGYHLLITGADALHGGKAITLRLTFAHAGTISVVGLVTNLESGGSSYFLN